MGPALTVYAAVRQGGQEHHAPLPYVQFVCTGPVVPRILAHATWAGRGLVVQRPSATTLVAPMKSVLRQIHALARQDGLTLDVLCHSAQPHVVRMGPVPHRTLAPV